MHDKVEYANFSPSLPNFPPTLGLYSGFAKMLQSSSMWTWTVYCSFWWKILTIATFLKLALAFLRGDPGRWL